MYFSDNGSLLLEIMKFLNILVVFGGMLKLNMVQNLKKKTLINSYKWQGGITMIKNTDWSQTV